MEHSRGNRVRQLREAKGWTGAQLAQQLHISPQYLYDLEKGVKRLNEETLTSLAEVFDVSTDYLLGRTDDPTPPGRSSLDISEDEAITIALSRAGGPNATVHPETIERIKMFIRWANHEIEEQKKADKGRGKGEGR